MELSNELLKRTRTITLVFGALFNLLYVGSNIISGLIYHSIWYFSLTLLHGLLLAARVYLLSAIRVETSGGDRDFRLVKRIGYSLLAVDTLTLALYFYSVMTESIVEYNSAFIYPILIYGIYSIVASLYGIFLSAKNKSPIYLAYRNLTLTTAIFTVFNLSYSLYLSMDRRNTLGVLFIITLGSELRLLS